MSKGVKGEMLFKPILGENERLLNSKQNPCRVRGLSIDDQNNRDIIEWDPVIQEDSSTKNTIIGAGISLLVSFVTPIAEELSYKSVSWAKEKVKEKRERRALNKLESKVKNLFEDSIAEIKLEWLSQSTSNKELLAPNHIAYTICSVLQVAKASQKQALYELESSGSKKRKNNSTELIEKYAVDYAAGFLDSLLSQEDFEMDEDTSRKIMIWLGGGIKNHGVYIPVNNAMVQQAMVQIHSA